MDEYWIASENTRLGHWQRKIKELTGSSTFCTLPWIHFATRPNGDMRLCCSANSSGAGENHTIGLVKNEKGVPANFGKDTPLSAWNNEYMKHVRTTMLENKIPKSCKKCFDEESKGVASKRVWELGTWHSKGLNIPELVKETQPDGTIPEKIKYLDLRLGHTCNLKCVMCSPHDSSQWVPEHKKIFPLFKHSTVKDQMQWDKETFNNFWHENPIFWEQMYDQISNLREVYFAGGEPLMIREHKLFLEEIVRRGYADRILIRYNSNALLLNDDIIELWKSFKQVKFAVSIDDIENRNYYIRYPSDWETITNNLHKLDKTPDNIHVSIATAIQILNIKTLPELAKWKINQKFQKINLSGVVDGIVAGGGILNMHLLYIPTFLSLRVLPEQDKKEVREIFKEFKCWLYENYTQDDDFWNKNPYGWKRWQAILEFMDQEDHTHLLPAFKEYINVLDNSRGTNFKNTFPSLGHLI